MYRVEFTQTDRMVTHTVGKPTLPLEISSSTALMLLHLLLLHLGPFLPLAVSLAGPSARPVVDGHRSPGSGRLTLSQLCWCRIDRSPPFLPQTVALAVLQCVLPQSTVITAEIPS